RRIAHDLSAPIDELVGWARAIGRGEPLPARGAERRLNAGEFAVLRESFRTMARAIELSRVRELEAERNRASIGLARGAAHELKNALTPLRFAVGALQRQVGGRPETKEAVDVIDAESERLETLARAFSQLG